MRKAKSLFLAVALLGIGQSAFSQTDLDVVGVSATVNPAFTLTLDQTALNYGNMVPTQVAWSNNVVGTVVANHSLPWVVTLQANELNDGNGHTIPGANFVYYQNIDNGDSNEIPAANGSTMPVPTVAAPIFEAGPVVYNTGGTQFSVGFQLTIPNGQAMGTYNTTLNFALVDGF